jgi:hypothetical protein
MTDDLFLLLCWVALVAGILALAGAIADNWPRDRD